MNIEFGKGKAKVESKIICDLRYGVPSLQTFVASFQSLAKEQGLGSED